MKHNYITFAVEEQPTYLDDLIEEYLEKCRNYLTSLSKVDAKRECLSGLNRFERSLRISSLDQSLYVKPGDIVYVDFGQAYLNETGFQHFGLILAMFQYKAFVVPMSSNHQTVMKAPNYHNGTDSRQHLFYIGQPEGMHRESVLFLNDAKFINTARIIEIKSHLDCESKTFRQIKKIYAKIFD